MTRQIIIVFSLISLYLMFAGCMSSEQFFEPVKFLQANKKKKTDPVYIHEYIGKNGKPIVADSKPKSPVPVKPLYSTLQMKYAELLDVLPDVISNQPLYDFIEKWYGTRYHFGGNSDDGIDCSAFVQKLYEDVFCVNLFRTAMEQFHLCRTTKNRESLNEGDLVFFKTTKSRRISHVGIYLWNHFFVHASRNQGVIISRLDEAYWSRRFAGAGQMLRD